eukprot:CAMPEP_0172445146 /NCGR_PEP_ID=MMETSP1065-20121228/5076_1 /TAXON_ID=265537 /ORGANISM="Amphiprora paludosa, Strain CCMP125" /LENGTH=509 /DNA_ID=CAMNT_0013195943 /DNA_START=56 /DNA_END=1585 /DNA_ORIENTATION=+
MGWLFFNKSKNSDKSGAGDIVVQEAVASISGNDTNEDAESFFDDSAYDRALASAENLTQLTHWTMKEIETSMQEEAEAQGQDTAEAEPVLRTSSSVSAATLFSRKMKILLREDEDEEESQETAATTIQHQASFCLPSPQSVSLQRQTRSQNQQSGATAAEVSKIREQSKSSSLTAPPDAKSISSADTQSTTSSSSSSSRSSTTVQSTNAKKSESMPQDQSDEKKKDEENTSVSSLQQQEKEEEPQQEEEKEDAMEPPIPLDARTQLATAAKGVALSEVFASRRITSSTSTSSSWTTANLEELESILASYRSKTLNDIKSSVDEAMKQRRSLDRRQQDAVLSDKVIHVDRSVGTRPSLDHTQSWSSAFVSVVTGVTGGGYSTAYSQYTGLYDDEDDDDLTHFTTATSVALTRQQTHDVLVAGVPWNCGAEEMFMCQPIQEGDHDETDDDTDDDDSLFDDIDTVVTDQEEVNNDDHTESGSEQSYSDDEEEDLEQRSTWSYASTEATSKIN